MDCRDAQTLLTAFHDGELPDADRARVEDHLRGCPECGRLLAELVRTDEAAVVPDPGSAYWERFNARLADRIDREEEGPRAAVLQPKPGWFRQQVRYLVPAVAVAALVVVVVRYGGRTPVAPTTPRPPEMSTTETSASLSEGRGQAKPEREPPAPETSREPSKSGRSPSGIKQAAGAPPAPPPVTGKKLPPPVIRAERDESADRLRTEEKERMQRYPAAASAEMDAPPEAPFRPDRNASSVEPHSAAADRILSFPEEAGKTTAKAAPPPSEPKIAAEAETASGMRRKSSSSPCETARELASRGRLKEAEAAQRECLARDPSPPAQEKGLIFLAELLDRQARFAEADEILTQVTRQFPESRPLDLYRRQRPTVQKQQLPVPVTR